MIHLAPVFIFSVKDTQPPRPRWIWEIVWRVAARAMAQDFAIFLRRLPGTISGAMTIKTIRWLIYPVLAFQLAAMFRVLRPSRFIAKSAATHIGAVHYNGGTSPFALGSAAVIVVVYLLLMFAKPAEFGKTLPGISRRIFAACIDFTLAMSIATPIGSLAFVVVAWRTTHVFQWIVQRDSPGPGEAFEALGSFLVVIGLLFFYFAWPLMRRRPTPGERVFHFQIVSDDEKPIPFGRAVSRAFYSPFTTWWWMRRRSSSRIYKIKEFQLDEDLDTHAVLIQ
jgi:hypothetical protein